MNLFGKKKKQVEKPDSEPTSIDQMPENEIEGTFEEPIQSCQSADSWVLREDENLLRAEMGEHDATYQQCQQPMEYDQGGKEGLYNHGEQEYEEGGYDYGEDYEDGREMEGQRIEPTNEKFEVYYNAYEQALAMNEKVKNIVSGLPNRTNHDAGLELHEAIIEDRAAKAERVIEERQQRTQATQEWLETKENEMKMKRKEITDSKINHALQVHQEALDNLIEKSISIIERGEIARATRNLIIETSELEKTHSYYIKKIRKQEKEEERRLRYEQEERERLGHNYKDEGNVNEYDEYISNQMAPVMEQWPTESENGNCEQKTTKRGIGAELQKIKIGKKERVVEHCEENEIEEGSVGLSGTSGSDILEHRNIMPTASHVRRLTAFNFDMSKFDLDESDEEEKEEDENK